MEYQFTREELLKAIEYLDQHPEEFVGRTSVKYDLAYNGKLYPPILVLSKANELRGGDELTIRDFNNSTEKAFKFFKENNFSIIEKEQITAFSPFLHDFLKQSLTSDLTNKKYKINFLGTKVKASFGQGGVANVSWISFTLDPNTTSQGIYPVYLYFKADNLLVLSFGISETNPPSYDWLDKDKQQTINELYDELELGTPFRYGDSFVYKYYDVNQLPSDEELNQDLKAIMDIYHQTMKNVNFSDEVSVKTSVQAFALPTFLDHLHNAHLQFNDALIKRFVASLITKPFVILTGLAGSGKTKLAQSFIQWICESEDQYKIVPVGADWINREPLLGYPNGLKQTEYVTPDNGVLQLIIDAAKEENQEKPYFLLLDEMNLSHVERYFADFLSIMESNDSIKLYTGSERTSTDGQVIPQFISWPKNLFIIGTVNIDETTYMFSPKVLDRANVIEFRLEEEDLSHFLSHPQKVELSQLIGKGVSMAPSFLALAQATATTSEEHLKTTLVQFFQALKVIGAEFGYRSAFEIYVLYAQLSKIDARLTVDEKVDFAVMQKLLPKLHGSRSKIVKSLEALMKLCVVKPEEFALSKIDKMTASEVKYKVSFDKLKRMYSNALTNGFTSYAEA